MATELNNKNKAVPKYGLSNEVLKTLATMPTPTNRVNSGDIPTKWTGTSAQGLHSYTISYDGSKTPDDTGYGCVITAPLSDVVIETGGGACDKEDGINV